ncbi:unnamed protein product [Gadus morhua 'NCC']
MSSCLLCSGGCTLSAHGFFLQSGLLPQMFISVPHEGKLLHAVSSCVYGENRTTIQCITPSLAKLALQPPTVTRVAFILDGFQTPQVDLIYVEDPLFQDPKLTSKDNRSVVELKGSHMDIEAMKCQVLTVSNHSCESLSVVGNTAECTVPRLLQGPARPKELQVEWRQADSVRTLGVVTLAEEQSFSSLLVGGVGASGLLLLLLASLLLWRRRKHVDAIREGHQVTQGTHAPASRAAHYLRAVHCRPKTADYPALPPRLLVGSAYDVTCCCPQLARQSHGTNPASSSNETAASVTHGGDARPAADESSAESRQAAHLLWVANQARAALPPG